MDSNCNEILDGDQEISIRTQTFVIGGNSITVPISMHLDGCGIPGTNRNVYRYDEDFDCMYIEDMSEEAIARRKRSDECMGPYIDLDAIKFDEIPFSNDYLHEYDVGGRDSQASDTADESEAYPEMTDEEYAELVEEVSSVAFRDEMFNDSIGFTAVKDGELTLSGHLHEILYDDKAMEEEVILDELWKRGWNPTDYHNERVIKMLLARSDLFRHVGNGWYCPGNGRKYGR
ncbi:MAG: hypothetical protein FVQ82_05285 [Planctomycetes bacterium]|nr:hypothetical protein [Planctomycetota bacterium]